MQHMKDPAAGVSPQLLPHMHLVSKHRYPTVSNLSLETVVGYLLEAPKIVRDLYPVQWQFLDPPPHDGHLMLVWQPLEYLGTNFASDGYVWGDPEVAFKSEVRGYTLEMFAHRSGYMAPNEPVASHSRRRYRLLPGNPALAPPDPSLWIVHYSKAAGRDHIPAASIPLMPHIHVMIQQRRIIQSQGLLVRKDFMLHDRANWPTINTPPGVAGRSSSGQMMPGVHRRVPSVNIAPGEATLEEEEDVSRGDMLDFLTPRDISRMRYEQHHEWMEEILESPYSTMHIIPTDLGLGRKGELEALTSRFFYTPTTAFPEANTAASKVGKMPPGKAEEFTKLASQTIAEMQSDLEKMKRKHARRMEKLKKAASLSVAEKKLRAAANGSADRDRRGSINGRQPQTTEEIMQEVEDAWGKKIERVTPVTLIEKGGTEERSMSHGMFAGGAARSTMSPSNSNFPYASLQTASSQQNEAAQYGNNFPRQQSLPRQMSQVSYHSVNSQASVPAEQSGDQDQDQDQSPPATSTRVSSLDQTNIQNPSVNDMDMDVDVEMDGLEDQDPAPEREMDHNEWVMVDEDGNEDLQRTSLSSSADQDQPSPQTEPQDLNATPGDIDATPASGGQEDTPVSSNGPQTETIDDAGGLDSGDFDITGDFDNVDVDTAGDALADYGADEEDLNLDTMDDSAFGEAFHPPDDSTPREDNDIS